MVMSGRTVQSKTQRAEAKVDREVRPSSRDLLLLPSLPSGDFLFCPMPDDDEEEADVAVEEEIDAEEEVGGGP